MSDYDISLLKLRSVLTTLKASMHNTADTSTRDEIDMAISLIDQQLRRNATEPREFKQLLLVLGKVLDTLPSVIAIIRSLTG